MTLRKFGEGRMIIPHSLSAHPLDPLGWFLDPDSCFFPPEVDHVCIPAIAAALPRCSRSSPALQPLATSSEKTAATSCRIMNWCRSNLEIKGSLEISPYFGFSSRP